jgi:PTS system galactitol-specific IIA component
VDLLASAQDVKIFARTQLMAKNRKAALRILVDMLQAGGCVKDSFWQALLDREAKFPTGLILDGLVNVALAHADTIHVKRSCFAVGVLDEPVQFQNMAAPEEVVDVKVIFVMAAENPKAVVNALQRLTEDVFQKKDVMERIAAADDDVELKRYLDEVITLAIPN